MQGTTFSSAQARERDKRIEEKHKKEIQALERKVENLKRTNDNTRKELWEVRQGATRLAECLGYRELSEVQQDLDMMSEEFNFRSYINRLQTLGDTADDSKAEVEVYARQLEEATKRIEELQRKDEEHW